MTRFRITPHNVLRRDDGQSLVEFAFVIPFVCLVILALVDFGRGLFFYLDATHVANQGARLAAVSGSSMSCTTLAQYIQQQTAGELRTGTSAKSGVQSKSTVTISFPPVGHSSPQIGDPVTVTVNASFRYSPTGLIPGSLPITAAATMRLEQAPGFSGSCTA